MSRTICLGYYDQSNLGDECFKLVLRDLVLQAHNVDEVLFLNPCGRMSEKELIDAVHDVKTRAVVVGGGDLIRDFWMPKIKHILKDFTRPKLAISIGISYPDCAPYLQFFDRIVVRSSTDLAMIKPMRNDASFCCDVSGVLTDGMPPKHSSEITKSIGICLAHPCFPGDEPSKREIIECLIHEVFEGMRGYDITKDRATQWHLYLLPFNTNAAKPTENDLIPQSLFLETFHRKIEEYPSMTVEVTAIKFFDTHEMLSLMSRQIDLIVGMRYHSIMFSLITKTSFIALYSQPKIKNLLQDTGFASSHRDVPMDGFSDVLGRRISIVLTSKDVIELPRTVRDFYLEALRITDLTSPSHRIIRDENVLFAPSIETMKSIIHNACRENGMRNTVETLRSKKGQMMEKAVIEFLLYLLRETRKACQSSGVKSCERDLEKAKQYAFGFEEALQNKNKASSSFQPELEWIIHHFIRNA